MTALPPAIEIGASKEVNATLRKLCRLRSTLEAFALRCLRENHDCASTFGALQYHAERLRAYSLRGLPAEFHQEDMSFHRTLVTASKLPELISCWELVAAQLDPWIFRVKIVHWPSLMSLYREHLFLLAAWEDKDLRFAEQATHHHLEAGWYRMDIAEGRLPEEGDAIDRVASYLSTHFGEPINIDAVAREIAFMSSSNLTRLFRRHFGQAPYAWLRQVRMDRAREFLVAGGPRSLAEVAVDVGYHNVSHFIRDFRGRFGITPKRYATVQARMSPAN